MPLLSRLLSVATLIAALALPVAGARAQTGAGCQAPATAVDRMVCANDGLRRAQRTLQDKVATLERRLPAPAQQHLARDQAQWEQARGAACAAGLLEPADCLGLLYEDRIALVDGLAQCARYPFVGQQALIETANRNRFHIYAAYPRFDGDTANFAPLNKGFVEIMGRVDAQLRQAANAATDKEDLYGYNQVYRLHCLSDVALGLEFENYVYGGLAHPQSSSSGYVVDLRTGGILAPDRLFATGSPWRQQLTALVARDLKRQLEAKGNGESMPSAADLARRMGEDRRYVFRRGKLAVVFDSGEIPPYADGARVVEIPYTALRPLLSPDAPLAD